MSAARAGRSEASTPWLLAEPDPDAEMRVFLFPYSGCGASMFQRWPTVRGGVELLRVQFPNRENRTREPHFGTYEQLADALVPGIAEHLDRPYAFFGHCGGVLPAYESALRAAELGLRTPTTFVASSQVVPHHGPHGRFLWLSEGELDDEIRTLLRRTAGRDTFPEEIIEIVRGILDADLEANRRYAKHVATPLASRVHAIGWDDDVEVPSELMSAWAECDGLGELAGHAVLHGDHYTFLNAPEPLLELIEKALRRTASAERSENAYR